MNGLSFVVAFGRSGGVSVHASDFALRVCLMWMSLTIYFCDIEKLMEVLAKDGKDKEQLVAALKEMLQPATDKLAVGEPLTPAEEDAFKALGKAEGKEIL